MNTNKGHNEGGRYQVVDILTQDAPYHSNLKSDAREVADLYNRAARSRRYFVRDMRDCFSPVNR